MSEKQERDRRINNWQIEEDDFEDGFEEADLTAAVVQMTEMAVAEDSVSEKTRSRILQEADEAEDWEEEADVSGKFEKAASKTEAPHKSQTAQSQKKTNRSTRSPRQKKQSVHPIDLLVGITGLVVFLFAIITFGVVLNDRGMDRQVEAFAEVGQELAQISVADESLFLAVADEYTARKQAAQAAEAEKEAEQETLEEQPEYNEKDEEKDITVVMNMTSVERDLKIKFTNKETGKLIPRVPFEVEIKGPTSTITRVDEDKDGIIYLTDLKGGNFKVRVIGPKDQEGCLLPETGQTITVKKEIEYKKIDVEDEIKTEAEVNAAVEDTEIKAEVESVLTDTIEWVESTKTAVAGDQAYTEVKKEDIPNPVDIAALPFARFAGISPITENETETESETETGSQTDPGDQGGSGSQTDQGDQNGSGSQTVPVTGVTVSPSNHEMKVGDTVSLSASVSPDDATDKSVQWSSSDSGVAEVDSSGTVTAKGTGSATIAVSAADGKSAAVSITVKAASVPVQSVSISGGTTLTVGEKLTLTASVSPDNATDRSVSWSSDNTGVATVDGSGMVTGVSAGTANITVTTSDGGKTASVAVTVKTSTIAVAEVKLSGADSVKVGETVKLTAEVLPADATDKSVTWKSSDASLATVDGSGTVKGVKAGSVDITASAGGKSATQKITVQAAAAAVTLTAKEMTLTSGESKKADYTVTGEVAETTYAISEAKYASVDSSGKIQALRAGETTYTVSVKFKDGSTKSASARLVIKAASVSTITLDKSSITLKVGEKLKLNASVESSGYKGCQWYTSDSAVVSVDKYGDGTITAVKAGEATVTVKASDDISKEAVCKVVVTASGKDPKNDTTTPLKDKNGKRLFVKNSSGSFVEAVVADYYKYDKFYRQNENIQYVYTGWQTIDGKRYFYDKTGNRVTGEQVIQGVKYTFGSDGAVSGGTGVLGIDVSKHNGSINWTEVKNSGVSFVIIRCGYRGSSTGAMIEDPKFRANIEGATAAGLKVGIYFFSQAVNKVEAIEEASMTLALINGYKISYPVFLDVEAAGGRADGLDKATRTEIVNTYCQTIRNNGYTAGIYANKNWLNEKMNTGIFGSYRIWLAQYAAAPTYNGRYEMWQYSSTGRIGGISGNVDLNLSFLGY